MSFPVNEQTLWMARNQKWPCKLGTMPALVCVHGSDIRRIAPGNRIRIKEHTVSSMPWQQVFVTQVATDGSLHFFADR